MRVMVPPEGMDVTGVKPRVTDTEDFPEIRSDDAMTNDTDVTCVKVPPAADAIAPEATGAEALAAFVETVMSPPAVAEPMMRPTRVIVVTAFMVEIAPPPVVMTMEVAPGGDTTRGVNSEGCCAVGVAVVAKKPDG